MEGKPNLKIAELKIIQFRYSNKNKKPTLLSGFCGTSSPDASGEQGTHSGLFFR
jgi:hypothetical protein